MRILVINWQDRLNPHAGGAELHLHEIFGRIARSGHKVDLLCSSFGDAPEREELDGISVHRVGTRYTFQFVARKYFEARLRRNRYDVIIEDLNKIPLYTPRWSLQPAKLVALVHHLFGATAFREVSVPMASLVWLSERPIARVYSGVPFEAVSQSTADDLVERGIERSSIRIIYNGVDVDRLTPSPEERSETPLFVYLGRLKKYKRVDLVIRAFAELRRMDGNSGMAGNATLAIAGTGDHRPALEALVRSLNLEGRVRFLGFVPEEDKVKILRRAWATVLASPKEGWGISNLESAACGTPVIAANSPGIRESVVDGKTGFLVPQQDAKALAAAMHRLVGSREMVRAMGENARKFAEQFTWDRSANDTIKHLQEVIAA